MAQKHRILARIKSYKDTISLLKKRIRLLNDKIIDNGDSSVDSFEEGEIRETDPKEKRKSKHPSKTKAHEVSAKVEEMAVKAKKDINVFLKEFFDQINSMELSVQKRTLEKVSSLLDNTEKYTILHDTVLFARVLEKYQVFYQVLYPEGIEKDGSEVSAALSSIYAFISGAKSEKDVKKEAVRLLDRGASMPVFTATTIASNAFDAVTAIRLYSKVLDWDWTYNVFVREHLFSKLMDTAATFPAYVLSILYTEWNRSLAMHKSLEYVLQTLDRIAGIGSGENITDSSYTLEAQLASVLVVRQFRPGAAVKWQKKRALECSPSEKDQIDSLWKLVIV
ncbi:hypothetical protein NEDG_01953 [Nematocida displodere]|uniref:Uncharacterized protein n=1 Tax=Nematocida displodere TaxID=1805483 RepID=A0A177EI75_9MICR|nr:hypothetical protein NEDG_01953 [Nematocida displodere]